MGIKRVEFRFLAGLARPIFRNARLHGSWDGTGRYAEQWTEAPISEARGWHVWSTDLAARRS